MHVASVRQTEAQAVAAPQQMDPMQTASRTPASPFTARVIPAAFALAAALAALAAFAAFVAGGVGVAPADAAVVATVKARIVSVSHQPVHVDREDWVRQGPIEVSVRVKGRTAPLFQASNRLDRWYVEAREGARYEVRVRNVTHQRVAFLIAVDGLNAINGQISRLASHEPMYVLDPFGNATIRGWRKDMRNVSQFVFVDEERSYAERTGQGNRDLGWIRVLAFREAAPYITDDDRIDGDREEEAPSADSYRDRAGRAKSQSRADEGGPPAPTMGQSAPGGPMAESSPGTGWGKNQRDPVRRVDFESERFATAQVVMRYEYRSALTALGILPWRAPSRDRLWERENGLYGFAQPPTR